VAAVANLNLAVANVALPDIGKAFVTAGAKSSFLDGAGWAYTAGIVAILLGFVLVFFLFPKRDEEQRLLARYHAEDSGPDIENGEEPGPEAPSAAQPRIPA
jgi:hypothetical protein